MDSGTRILVTGGAGFVGSNLVNTLKDYQVTVLDDFTCSDENNLKDFNGELIKESIVNFDWSSVKPDIIFHEAAITDTTIQENVMEVNYEASTKLLEFVRSSNTDLIYASSAAVYGKSNPPMIENQEMTPANVYGESKAKMDEEVMPVLKENNKIIGLRYFNVFGPNEYHKGKFASMIYQLYNQMLIQKPKIFKFGEQKRDFVFVEDVVKANLLSMKSKNNGIFNVGTGESTTFNMIVELLNKFMEKELEPDYFDNPYDFYQEGTCANLDSIEKNIGYKPDYTTEEGIKKYVEILSVK